MNSVKVKIRYSGGTWIARAGRGKRATTASSTNRGLVAARRAAAKYFGLDECNVLKAEHLVFGPISFITSIDGSTVTVSLPEQKGGAS